MVDLETVTNQEIVRHLLISEGWPAFTDHPADRGGPTRGGITLETLSAHRGATVTEQDLRDLTEDEAILIYTQRYLLDPNFVDIEDGLLRWQVVDCGVLSGPVRAAKWLQKAAGVDQDGKIGPATLAAVNASEPHSLALKLAAARVAYLGRLISSNRDQAVFAAGWMARSASFVEREAERATKAL